MKLHRRKTFSRIIASNITVLLIITFLIGSFSAKAAAPSQVLEKAYSVQTRSDDVDALHIISNPNDAAFWEYPDLKAGQQKTGVFTIKNETTKTILVKLKSLAMPYYNSNSLRYLQHINVIITRDKTIVYDGDYGSLSQSDLSQIVDFSLVPNELKKFEITLKCDFNYDGNLSTDPASVAWLFSAEDVDSPAVDDKIIGNNRTAFLLMFAGCVVGIGIIIGTALRVTDKRKRFKRRF